MDDNQNIRGHSTGYKKHGMDRDAHGGICFAVCRSGHRVGIFGLLFEATFDAGINVNMISTSEIKISLLVDEKDADRAAVAIHDKFITDDLKL